ncbi:MAG: hypothetical protein LBQ23_03785 [Puniceicoccales bacterium]|nr:hypothetical protein [Puniceicoccales bacterium]
MAMLSRNQVIPQRKFAPFLFICIAGENYDVYSVLDRDSPIIKIESDRKSVIKIGNMAPEIGKFIFKSSPVVLDWVEVRRIGR